MPLAVDPNVFAVIEFEKFYLGNEFHVRKKFDVNCMPNESGT